MKVIKNKEIQIKDKKSSFGDLLKACINAPDQNGFTIEDIEKRLRILKGIGEKEIKLEDADHNTAVEVINKMRWFAIDQNIIDFRNAFLNKE
ncbi:MAG: hypothetical protein GY760_15960 [Deltaproteobacteria bacterium]|nr:hypothetical protein [Deltaproteobacteria bacterium]